MEPQFKYSNKQKTFFVVLMTIGLFALLFALFMDSNNRVWPNIILNTLFFLFLSLSGTFFVSVHVVVKSGWHTSIQRIPEAMGSFVPVSAVLMIPVLFLGGRDIYDWINEPIAEKSVYLNLGFLAIRLFVYFGAWIFLSYKLRQLSLNNDLNPDLNYLNKLHLWAVLFLVVFAITNSTSSWDFLMSIDQAWYSTLYAWYVFASLFVAGIAAIILILLYLRSKGYMTHTNNEHLHDLGKYLFGLSVFWAYLWYSQYMLIWYGNIPEETTYFSQRMEEFSVLFYFNIILNFCVPFLALLPRNSPRKVLVILVISVLVLIGHWIDFYLLVMPGTLGSFATIGILEIGLALGFVGLFLFVVFRALSKGSLVPNNHPFLKESQEYRNL